MSVYWGIAESHEGLEQFAEAIKAWKQSIEVAPNATEKHIRQMRLAMALANHGNLEELTQVEQELESFSNQQSETYYRIARAFAICAANFSAESQPFLTASTHTLDALSKARDMGQFKDPASLKRFTDDEVFEVFETVEEFKKFIDEL
jgi:tetratricopeptide (TPR) repeat protein